MNKFLGREKELQILQNLYNKNSFKMSIVYGRRRIGKTMLVNEFIKRQDCKKISFTAVEQNESSLISLMKDVVINALAPDMVDLINFTSFDNLFEFISRYAQKERIIFFIDEYPYLAKQCPYIQSLIQKYIDTSWKNTNLFFIICGSLVGFMKDEVLAESAPLYGRSDLVLNLHPFDYKETALFLNGYSDEDKAIVYGLTGGVAKYIEQFDCNLSLDENIVNQFFSLGGYFSEEQIKTIITSEKQNPAMFNSIISAVAMGYTKNNEIASYVSMDDITYPLKLLVKADILERRVSKKPYYVINDSTLEFWFRYVNRAISLINMGNGRKYYETYVKKDLHNFMGRIFEKMAKDFLLKNSGTLLVPLVNEITDYQSINVDKDGVPHQIEIDLYGKEVNKICLLGECKFKNEKFDKNDLEIFLQKVRLIHGEKANLYLFSLSGFSDYVLEHKNQIQLITLKEMY